MEENELVTAEVIRDVVEANTPVKKIEAGLSSFLENTFRMVNEEDDYKKKLQAEVIGRLPQLKNSELIALLTSASTNLNDQMSKVVSPTMQLLTEAQRNEIASKQKEVQNQQNILSQHNFKELNMTAPAEVIGGFKALVDLMTAAKNAVNDENTRSASEG